MLVQRDFWDGVSFDIYLIAKNCSHQFFDYLFSGSMDEGRVSRHPCIPLIKWDRVHSRSRNEGDRSRSSQNQFKGGLAYG